MTVAYCVLSHTQPDQVVRLARTLRTASPSARVLIHHDPSGPRLSRAALDAVGGVRAIAPVGPVRWGMASQLDALLALVTVAVRETDADWVVLLSGQDAPARPVAEIEADLAASAYDGYVDGHVVTPPGPRDRRSRAWRPGSPISSPPDEFQRRYFWRWRALPGDGSAAPGRRARLLRAGAHRLATPLAPRVLVRDVPAATLVGVPARRTPFTDALPCRRGQDWLTLHRRAAEALVRAARDRPDLLAYYRRTVLATESFPHTVLHAEPGLRLSGVSRRHVEFEPGSPHPRTFGVADVPAIVASGADFARKLSDPAALDALGRALGGPAAPMDG